VQKLRQLDNGQWSVVGSRLSVVGLLMGLIVIEKFDNFVTK